MTKKGKIKEIFPFCVENTRNLEPVVFKVPAKYNKKVMIHDWQMEDLAEPRDNVHFFPPGGNLRTSSYRRIGPEEDTARVTETQAMLSQIERKEEYKAIYPKRSLLNMHSFALADYEQTDEELKLTDLLIDPEELEAMDYCTTSKIAYKLPYPLKSRPSPPTPLPEPWLLNRRAVGYSAEQLENRWGVNTFLDDNLEPHRRVAELKMRRNEIQRLLDTQCKDSPSSRGTFREKQEDNCVPMNPGV